MRIPRHSRSTLAGRGVDTPKQSRRAGAGATIVRRLTALGGLALVLPLALPAAASADVLDAADRFTARFDGAVGAEQAGITIATIGDQNGDGRPDFAIGIPEASNGSRDASGSVYIVYSPPAPGLFDLGSLTPAQGYRIDGAESFDSTGSSVAPAGDVNGDGVMDILIGAPGAGNNDRQGSGTVWVVFGAPRANGLDLAMLSVNGLEIDGGRAGDTLGGAVASAGDINGDGAVDFMLGAPGTDSRAGANSGSVYLVFGPKKGDTSSIDLNGLNAEGGTAQGYRVDGGVVGIGVGTLIANAGDQNGDNVPDMAVGVPGASNNERGNSGSVYVLFGRKTASPPISLLNVGGAGYRVDGGSAGDGLGASLASVGDLNGDGRLDLLLGAPSASYRDRAGSGSAYVVFSPGAATTIDLANIGAGGFRIDGATVGEAAGTAVASAGDANKDGRPDILIGAPGASNNGRDSSGAAYLVTTPAGGGAIDLAALGTAGMRVDGASAGDNFGLTLQGAGDQNGDGAADVLIGAPAAGFNKRESSGSVYLIPATFTGPIVPPPPGPGPIVPVPPVLSPAARDLQNAFGLVASQPHRAQYNFVLRAIVSSRRAIKRSAPLLEVQLPIGGNVRVYGKTATGAPQRASATAFTNLFRGHLKFVRYDGTTYAARNGGRFRTIRGPFGILLHSLAPSSFGQDPAAVVGQLTNVLDSGYARVAGIVTGHYRASLTDAALKSYLTSAFSTLGFSPRLVPTALRMMVVKRNTLDFYVQRSTNRIVAQSLSLDITVNLAKLAKQRRLGTLPKTALMTVSTRGQVKLTGYGRKLAIAKPTVSGRPATIIDLLRLG